MSTPLEDEKLRAEIAKIKAETAKAEKETADIDNKKKKRLQWWTALGPLLTTLLTGIIALYFAFKSQLFEGQTKYVEAEKKEAQMGLDSLGDKKVSLNLTIATLQHQKDSLFAADSVMTITSTRLKHDSATLHHNVDEANKSITSMREENNRYVSSNKDLQNQKGQLMQGIDGLQNEKKALLYSIDSLTKSFDKQLRANKEATRKTTDMLHDRQMQSVTREEDTQRELRWEKEHTRSLQDTLKNVRDSLNMYRKKYH